jgi:thiol:disulfide interchange protein DsbG
VLRSRSAPFGRPARLALAFAAALALAGCKDSSAPGASGAPAAKAQSVSVEAIASEAKGFSVGPSMAARTVYVFFDPQCPHCAALWDAAKPLKSQARFVWLPVSLLNASSAPQGATLLAAADPVAAMDQHEKLLREQRGGITAASDIDAQKQVVARNTELFNRFGLGGVPAIVARHAQTGELVVREGSMPTAALAAVLGLQGP